jgi:hypothetical protein
MTDHVLCSISTRNRYRTSLPLALSAVINQSRPPNQVIVFDDSDPAEDLRQDPVYQSLFAIMNHKNIGWEWIWAGKKGQHHNHQMANIRARQWVWRVDDDVIPEPGVLATLLSHTNPSVGGVATAVLTPSWDQSPRNATGRISLIDQEPNIQWGRIHQSLKVEHLHCSFLYRGGEVDYNLGLSTVAHREETLFSWQLHQKGFELWVVPGPVTWHLKLPSGGIRVTNNQQLYDHDETVFKNFLAVKDRTIVVLDCGLGDHVVASHVLPKIRNPLVFSCYPHIVPGQSIQEAKDRFGSIDQWNIYKKMSEWNWSSSLEQAFCKLYGVES